jgi:hypothetical protein
VASFMFHSSMLKKTECCRLPKRPSSDSLAEPLIGRVRPS